MDTTVTALNRTDVKTGNIDSLTPWFTGHMRTYPAFCRSKQTNATSNNPFVKYLQRLSNQTTTAHRQVLPTDRRCRCRKQSLPFLVCMSHCTLPPLQQPEKNTRLAHQNHHHNLHHHVPYRVRI